ncbi:hypothetical protein K438DRAFT_1957625 [Mycena galopus ATCC 62051]|nr:hypothetical protein K438DRAFT_1957625 [Mycena galopus ATCC 62051]
MDHAFEAAADCNRHDEPEMKTYLTLAKAFQTDFGFPYCFDLHLNHMAFRASVEEDLGRRFNHDATKIAAEISKPATLTLRNPYADDDLRQLVAETKFREFKLEQEGPRAVEALPQTINVDFPFIVQILSPNEPTEFYDALFSLHLLEQAVLRL